MLAHVLDLTVRADTVRAFNVTATGDYALKGALIDASGVAPLGTVDIVCGGGYFS